MLRLRSAGGPGRRLPQQGPRCGLAAGRGAARWSRPGGGRRRLRTAAALSTFCSPSLDSRCPSRVTGRLLIRTAGAEHARAPRPAAGQGGVFCAHGPFGVDPACKPGGPLLRILPRPEPARPGGTRPSRGPGSPEVTRAAPGRRARRPQNGGLGQATGRQACRAPTGAPRAWRSRAGEAPTRVPGGRVGPDVLFHTRGLATPGPGLGARPLSNAFPAPTFPTVPRFVQRSAQTALGRNVTLKRTPARARMRLGLGAARGTT